MTGKLLQITAPHFCAGMVIDHAGLVAPILQRMRGWSYLMVAQYCRERGWGCEIINQDIEAEHR